MEKDEARNRQNSPIAQIEKARDVLLTFSAIHVAGGEEQVEN
jgi:hypothetical protein